MGGGYAKGKALRGQADARPGLQGRETSRPSASSLRKAGSTWKPQAKEGVCVQGRGRRPRSLNPPLGHATPPRPRRPKGASPSPSARRGTRRWAAKEQVCTRGEGPPRGGAERTGAPALLARLQEPRAGRTRFLPGAGVGPRPPRLAGRAARDWLRPRPPPPGTRGVGGGAGTQGAARAAPGGVSRASGAAAPPRRPRPPPHGARCACGRSAAAGMAGGAWAGMRGPDGLTRDLRARLRWQGSHRRPADSARRSGGAGGAHGTCALRLGGRTEHLLGVGGPLGTCRLRPGGRGGGCAQGVVFAGLRAQGGGRSVAGGRGDGGRREKGGGGGAEEGYLYI